VIESGADLESLYCKAFKKDGGDPDICMGVLWTRSLLASEPAVMADDIFERMALKIVDGTADHGWLIGIMRYLWHKLDESQRLRIIDLMGPHVSKSLLNRKMFDVEFTKAEKLALIGQMKRAKCPGAVKVLGG